jgi:hypothetical protein
MFEDINNQGNRKICGIDGHYTGRRIELVIGDEYETAASDNAASWSSLR